MKKVLLATLAMATVLASPALAQTKHRYTKQHASDRLSAYAAPVPSTSRRSPNRSNDAYVNGRAVNFNMTATANGGNYSIDEDTMSRLLNNGALRYIV